MNSGYPALHDGSRARDHGYSGWITVEHDKADKLGGDYSESTAISRWYAKNVLDEIYEEGSK